MKELFQNKDLKISTFFATLIGLKIAKKVNLKFNFKYEKDSMMGVRTDLYLHPICPQKLQTMLFHQYI